MMGQAKHLRKVSRVGGAQAGFSLVELMVGIGIALMASLAIFQTFAASEEQRRTTSSGSEGLQGGTLAMAQVQAVVRNAGYNLVTPTDFAFTQPNRSVSMGVGVTIPNNTPVPTEFLMGCLMTGGMRIAPVLVNAGLTSADSDSITIMEGSSAASPLPAQLMAPHPSGSITLNIKTTYGYAINDWVIVYEQSGVAPNNQGTTRDVPCTFARVTALPLAPVLSPAAITLSTGTVAAYSLQARVVNLGPNPLFQRLTVDSTRRLVLTNLRTNTNQILADDVQTMKVQVGVDVSADDLVDEWINPPALVSAWTNPSATPTVPSVATLPIVPGTRSLNQIKALRIGLLLRSPQFERANPTTGLCETTGAGPFSVLPAISGSTASRVPNIPASPTYTLSGTQRCYRYNTVSAVVPLRNIIMSDL